MSIIFMMLLYSTEDKEKRLCIKRLYQKFGKLMRQEALLILGDNGIAQAIYETCSVLAEQKDGEKVAKTPLLPIDIVAATRVTCYISIMKKLGTDHKKLFDSMQTISFIESHEPYVNLEDICVASFIELKSALNELPKYERYLLETKLVLGVGDSQMAQDCGIRKSSVLYLYTLIIRRIAASLVNGNTSQCIESMSFRMQEVLREIISLRIRNVLLVISDEEITGIETNGDVGGLEDKDYIYQALNNARGKSRCFHVFMRWLDSICSKLKR